MKINDLLDLPLREVLNDYFLLQNLECGYYYGVAKYDDIDKIFENYNIREEYPEAMNVENFIPSEVIVNFDEPIIDYSKLEKIVYNLGITKKKEFD